LSRKRNKTERGSRTSGESRRVSGFARQTYALLSVGILVIAAAIVAVVIASSGSGPDEGLSTALAGGDITFGHRIGSAAAPVTIVEFGDFQ